MEKVNQKIQYFAQNLQIEIQEIESNLLIDKETFEEEKRLMIMSETLSGVLEKYENVFSDILFKE
jgi:hypothetical protein